MRYTSPICRVVPRGRIYSKFCMVGRITDVAMHLCKILWQSVMGFRFLQGVEFWHSPLIKSVAVNTVLALPRSL